MGGIEGGRDGGGEKGGREGGWEGMREGGGAVMNGEDKDGEFGCDLNNTSCQISPICSNASVAHAQVDPPAASMIRPMGAASNRRRSLALARREEALEMTP